MATASTLAVLQEKYAALAPLMDERLHRLWAASEAWALGWGGITLVAQATGLSQTTIRAGLATLTAPPPRVGEGTSEATRIRRRGGGRKPLSQTDQTLCRDLKELVDPATRGDPQSTLCWTCKSTRPLADALVKKGHLGSHQTVERLLRDMGYRLQVNRKTREGSSPPDRNAQFEHIARKVRSFQRRGQPVISVDTKKKELVGNFKNAGREWPPQGQAEQVRSKDFKDKKLGKVAPYGVYDLTANEGWVSVGIDHATAEFATESIHRWWQRMGSRAYPHAKSLLVTADGGGSKSSRRRLWKVAVQRLANALGLRLTVCHFPPGTSKWNKIEHRMFCHITENWRGKPLVSRAVIVSLIGSTTTRTGLRVKAELDTNLYAQGVKVSAADLAAVKMKQDTFHGEWNYTIVPND